MNTKLIMSHTHECPDCSAIYECFCDVDDLLKQCPDCFNQLKLIELND